MTGSIRVEGFAEGHFSAAHRERGGRERLHGHTYQVRAWWAGRYGEQDTPDAVERQQELRRLLRSLDHGDLDEVMENTTAENICFWLITRLPWASRVRVWRGVEGLGAEAART